MKLSEWRIKKKLTLEAVALLIGVKTSSVHYYENGRIPKPAIIAKIEEVTNRKVRIKDFY